jgi:hypothetical protein
VENFTRKEMIKHYQRATQQHIGSSIQHTKHSQMTELTVLVQARSEKFPNRRTKATQN